MSSSAKGDGAGPIAVPDLSRHVSWTLSRLPQDVRLYFISVFPRFPVCPPGLFPTLFFFGRGIHLEVRDMFVASLFPADVADIGGKLERSIKNQRVDGERESEQPWGSIMARK